MNAKKATTALKNASKNIYSKKWSFLVAFLVFLFVSVFVFITIGFIPNPPKAKSVEASTSTDTLALIAAAAEATPIQPVTTAVVPTAALDARGQVTGELPTKVTIESIGLNATIANPTTTNIEALDQYLLHGAVRYPTSATLGQNGNVILFAHSSYLPIVNNQAYKAFDGIQKLKTGDKITVYSATHTYVYAVQSVEKESATSGYAIPIAAGQPTLTLATCNSFGTKSDRFVVTATLVGSYALGS